MTDSWLATREAVYTVLEQHFKGVLGRLAEQDLPLLTTIATEAATYAAARQGGSETAAQNMEHLEAQVGLLAARIRVREGRELNATLLQIARVAAEVAGELLKRIIV